MSIMREPSPATLVFSIFSSRVGLIDEAAERLSKTYGPVELQSQLSPFDFTEYYSREFGLGLQRRFYAMEPLVPQECLAEVKHCTWELEDLWSADGRRRVNVDPGLITAERLVLATGKNFIHRIYLGRGVFADLTLIYQGDGLRPLSWTYPDYATPESVTFWNDVRRRHLTKIRRNRGT